MMKSGIEQLREEKYRFTIETQGLSYASKDRRLVVHDEDAAWSGDDSDQGVVPKKTVSPLAQRMVTQLKRVLEEGGSRGFTDEALERLLAGSLQSGSDVHGYDVAKDYIKQVLGHLYGEENIASSNPGGPGNGSKRSPVQAPVGNHTAPNRSFSSTESSRIDTPAAPGQCLSLLNPTQVGAQTAIGAFVAPPWTAAIRLGSGAGAGGASVPPSQPADPDEVERPRPRPHHGRIKEQLGLLQNADQLAAIISVATTAATTAAAAAVKQTMQTPPALPPGAYARIHAAGQPMCGLPAAAAAETRAPQAALHQRLGAGTAPQTVGDTFGDESPDPQPQQRHGTLVSPHRRSTPMAMARHQGVDARAGGSAQASGTQFVECEQQGVGELAGWAGLGPSSREAQLRRQRLRWSQRRGVPLGPSPVGAREDGKGAASPIDTGSGNAGGISCSSNLRVVRLSAPRVTTRTPTPVRPGPQEGLGSRAQQVQAVLDATKGADEHDPGRAGGDTLSRVEEGASAGSSNWNAVGNQLSDRCTRAEPAVGNETKSAVSTGTGAEAVSRLPAGTHALRPGCLDPQAVTAGSAHAASQEPPARNALLVARDVTADGYFFTGGESVFTRAQAAAGLALSGPQACAKEAAPKASELVPAGPSRRSGLPEDVQDAFRSTLAFISDPDGARTQQHKPPSWAALADGEERKEAQREAAELLGGTFDYAAVKRELERARRASQLMQHAAGHVAPSPGVDASATATPPLKKHAAGGRPLPVSTTATFTGLSTKVTPQPRGDFAGLLPPPHSVWDVDEAWFDLDEFTKAVEAEVAYRAAAVAVGPSRRGSPGVKQAGQSATTITVAAGQTVQAARTAARLPPGQATYIGTTTAPGTGPGLEQPGATARTGGRKRAISPGPQAASRLRTVATTGETSPSPPRPVRKTRATGAARIAFGRRVDEPLKVVEAGASRARLDTPPITRGSPGRARIRTRKTGSAIAEKSPPPSPSPSSTGDAVHQVLSALASVLLSDGDGAGDDDSAGPGGVNGAPVDEGFGLLGSRADSVAHRDARKVAAHAKPALAALPRAVEPEHTAPLAQLPAAPQMAAAGNSGNSASSLQHAQPQPQQIVSGSEQLGNAPEPPTAQRMASGVENGSSNVVSAAAVPGSVGAAGSNAAPVPMWPQPGFQPWPNTTATSRPRFQYLVDTAHPPVTRLPSWAASAASAEGAPAAYAATLGTAPTGWGFSSPTRRRDAGPAAVMPFPAAVCQPVHVPGQLSNPFERRDVQQAGGNGNAISAADLTQHQGQQQQPQQPQPFQQQLLLASPAHLRNNTHILPPQAAAAAVADATAAPTARVRVQRVPDPGQQFEKAVMQVMEDELVSRLAVAQLAAQSQAAGIFPQDLHGMVLPLVDLELSRRLVSDVLLDNLRGLMASPRQEDPSAAPEAAAAPTLEEVVAALAAMPVLPSPRPQQPAVQEGWAAQCSHPGSVYEASYDNVLRGEGSVAQPGVIGVAAVVGGVAQDIGSDASSRVSASGAQSLTTAGNEGCCGSTHNAASSEAEVAGSMGGQDSADPGAAASVGVGGGSDTAAHAVLEMSSVPQTWQPVYTARRARQLSQAVQAAPDAVPAAVQADGHDPSTPVGHADISTGLSVQDLGPDMHIHATLQYSTAVSHLTSFIPPTVPSEPMPGSLTKAALPLACSVPATMPPRGPLSFAMAPGSSVSTPSAVAAVAAGSGGQRAQPAILPQDQGAAAGLGLPPGSSGEAAQQSPRRSQGVQAYGVQARGVQAHGVEARGLQASGVVEARAVQAHGTEARGTQAAGVQERGTQAAGVMDRSSQADPPPPDYLLQAALAAGLSNGAGFSYATNGVEGGQPILAPDGSLLNMPRPFYLVPAGSSQLPSAVELLRATSGFAFPPLTRGKGSRGPLNIPGLSKLRDSSDVESSTDSMARQLQAPGARAPAVAFEALRLASRGSLDSDDGLLQRSYAPLELATLTARPVRLDQHRTPSQQSLRSQTIAAELGRPQPLTPTECIGSAEMDTDASVSARRGSSSRGGASQPSGPRSGQADVGSGLVGSASLRRESGLVSNVTEGCSSSAGEACPPRYLTRSNGPPSRASIDGPHDTSLGAVLEGVGSEPPAESAHAVGGTATERPSASSSAPFTAESLATASRVSSFAVSEQPAAAPSGSADNGAPHSSKDVSALPSGESSGHSAAHNPVATAHTPAVRHVATRGPMAAAASTGGPPTPVVGDDELVGDDEDEGSDQIRSVHFEFSEDRTGLATDVSERTSALANVNPALEEAVAAPTGSADASRAASERFGGSARSDAAEPEPSSVADLAPLGDGRARTGERYGRGMGEAEDFALSDDELLDEAEVARVLEEEDARQTEDAVEDEEDEALRLMGGQVITLEESSFEDDVGLGVSPSPHGNQADKSNARTPLEDGSGAVQCGEEGSTWAWPKAVAQPRSAGGGSGSGSGGGNAAESRQASDVQPGEQSRGTPSSASSVVDSGTVPAKVGSGNEPAAAAGRRGSCSGADAVSMSATSSQRGKNASSGSSVVKEAVMVPWHAPMAVVRGLSDAEVTSEVSYSTKDSTHSDIENQSDGGAGCDADKEEVALRTSLERLAMAGLAPMGRLQAGVNVGSSGLMRATVASVPLTSQQLQSGALRTRPALAPLQPAAIQHATSSTDGGATLQPPDSPSKPPSLAAYHGPTRQLWRPPSAQQLQDALSDSTETLMASSEASGPTLDPLSRTLLYMQRSTHTVGPASGLSMAAAKRMQDPGAADSIESWADVSSSMDSVPAPSAPQPLAVAVVSRQLARMAAAVPTSLAAASAASARGQLPSGVESRAEDDRPTPGGLRHARAVTVDASANEDASGLGLNLLPGRDSRRRDGALFRLRQYSARRRKLLQQIGVKDPLLLSSTTSLSTDSSATSDRD